MEDGNSLSAAEPSFSSVVPARVLAETKWTKLAGAKRCSRVLGTARPAVVHWVTSVEPLGDPWRLGVELESDPDTGARPTTPVEFVF